MKKKSKKTMKLSKPMKKAIVKLVETKFETNYIMDNGSLNNVAFNSSPNANGDAFFLLNQINVGTGSAQRIGNTIQNVAMTVKGYVTLSSPFSAGARAIAVRLMLLRQRTLPLAITGLSWTSLLRASSSYNAFTGAGYNLFQHINRCDFEVFGDKIIHLKDVYSANSADITQMNHPFSLSAVHKGKVNYEDGTNVLAWNPFFCVGYIYEDGSGTIDTVSTNIVVSAILEAYYKDA